MSSPENTPEMYERRRDGSLAPLSPARQESVLRFVELKRGGRRQSQSPQQADEALRPTISAGVTGGTRVRPVVQPHSFARPGEFRPGSDDELQVLAAAAIEIARIRSGGDRPIVGSYMGDNQYGYDSQGGNFDFLPGEVVAPQEPSFLDRFTTRQKLVGVALIASGVVGAGIALQPEEKDNSTVAAATTLESTKEAQEPASKEYKPGPIAAAVVADLDVKVTASTMWDFKIDKAFDKKIAIGVSNPDDTSFSLTTTPEIKLNVAAEYNPKAKSNAVTDITKKGEKQRSIQIDMSQLDVTAVVDAESLKDTTAIPFFQQDPEAQMNVLSKAFDTIQVSMTQAKLAEIYNANKNYAEYQAGSLGVQLALNDAEKRKKIIDNTKAAITKQLGISDPAKYKVTFINDKKFAPPQAVADKFIKSNKIDTSVVRPVNNDQIKPVVVAEIKESKQV